jgi:hypothetical protein
VFNLAGDFADQVETIVAHPRWSSPRCWCPRSCHRRRRSRPRPATTAPTEHPVDAYSLGIG